MKRLQFDHKGRAHERATLTISYDLNIIFFKGLVALLRAVPGVHEVKETP